MSFFYGYYGQLVLNWAILAIAAFGFRWTFLAGQFSLAHAALMGAGAYATAQAASVFGFSAVPALLLGVGVALALSLLLSLLAVRLGGLFLSIATLAFGFALLDLIEDNEWLGGPFGLTPPFLVEPWHILLSLVLVLLLSLMLDARNFGALFRAVSDDQLVAESSGINFNLVRMYAWLLGGGIVGLAGGLFALSIGSISPLDFGFDQIVLMLLAVLLGGAATPIGPVVGAALVTLLPELVRLVDVDRAVIYGPVLALLVILRPSGLISGWPAAMTRRELPRQEPSANEEGAGQIDARGVAQAPKGTGEVVLSVRDLSLAFGGVHALRGVSFDVKRGGIHALIGPNGAGKTTLVNVITGALTPDSGSVHFSGRDITRLSMHQRARVGMSRTFQSPRLLPTLNLVRNVSVGRWGFAGSLRRTPVSDAVSALMRRLGLHDLARREVITLNLAERRRAEVVRALSSDPELLLLDEPTAGMNHVEARALIDEILDVCRQTGTTLLLIEHNMSIVMSVSEEIVVLSFGEVIASGAPDVVRQDSQVVSAYLGVST
jgi:branched-chain amino acid transport system permease protein